MNFQKKNLYDILCFFNLILGQYQMSLGTSTECMGLIQGILQQRPFARLTLSHIIRHPWLEQFYPPATTSRSTSVEDRMTSDHSSGKGHHDLNNKSSRNTTSFDDELLQENPSKLQREHEVLRRQDTTAILLPATRNRALSKTIPTREQLLYGLVSPPELEALAILHEIGISESIIELHR